MEIPVAIEDNLGKLRERTLTLIHQLAIADGEKELLVKEALFNFDNLHDELGAFLTEHDKNLELLKEENKLTRSFLGQDANELRARILSQQQEQKAAHNELALAQDEVNSLRERITLQIEKNAVLKKNIQEAEQKIKDARLEGTNAWESQVSAYSEQYDTLQAKIKDTEEKITGLRELLTTQAIRLSAEKQAEITTLQIKLLEDMHKTLKTRQGLQWAEEELFARGVAYKFRGRLQSIVGRFQFALERFKLLEPNAMKMNMGDRLRLLIFGPGEFQDAFATIKSDLDQVMETLEEYLSLTLHRAPEMLNINLGEVVKSTVAGVFTERRPELNVQNVIESPLPEVAGDRQLLSLVIGAVLENALESLAEGKGVIKTRVYLMASANELHVDVQDSGDGIKPEFQEKIFQPFFSTKPGHRGLGLSRAKRFLSWHNGFIRLINSDSHGSQFTIALPVPEINKCKP